MYYCVWQKRQCIMISYFLSPATVFSVLHAIVSSVLDQEAELENNNNSLLWPLSHLPGSDSSGLDYLLALSLQSDGDTEEPDMQQGLWTDVWDRRLGRAPAPSTFISQISSANNNNTPASTDTSSEIMLPCEFCEELFPEEDLILHQVRVKPLTVHQASGFSLK